MALEGLLVAAGGRALDRRVEYLAPCLPSSPSAHSNRQLRTATNANLYSLTNSCLFTYTHITFLSPGSPPILAIPVVVGAGALEFS